MLDGDGRYPDDPALAALGAGTLVIDALTGQATHNGRVIEPPLAIAERMRRWLIDELARHGVEWSHVRRATVTAPYTREEYRHEGSWLWETVFTCSSEVATDEQNYRGSPIPGRPSFSGSVQRPYGRR